MIFQRIREKINLLIYDSKERVLAIFKYLNVIVTLTAVATLVYYYGFPQDTSTIDLSTFILKCSFGFYITHFFIRLFYDFEPGQFLRDHWIEAIMMLVLFIEGLSSILTGKLLLQTFFQSVGFSSFEQFSTIFIQLYFFFVVLIGLTRTYTIMPFIRLHPATLFLLTFLLLIISGTGLLMLPEMTVQEGSMSFIDALFTSTSASCVTGLSVVDVSTYFTLKGQMVILMLIKVGGLNIVGFVAFIILMSKFGIGVKYHSFMDDYAKRGTIESALRMLRKILVWSLFFELSGALLFYFFLGDDNPLTPTGSDRFFASVFHSVSAFNNAGFSIFQDGMFNEFVRHNYFLHIVLMVLIFLGSLGFMAIFDLFSVENVRDRMRNPWKRINFNTKIALNFSIILVLAGFVMFFMFEYYHTLNDKNSGEKVVTALFQSVTTRTAGFNTVDIGSLSTPTLIFFMFLMFVGASSNSTGGGIKTSTFAILWASTVATMRERKNVELFKRTISSETVLKAFTILLFFIAWNLIAILMLMVTEQDAIYYGQHTELDVIFEQVSAFGTVGLSTGVTSSLTVAGKIIITLSMFTGKIGALTLAYLFGKKALSTNYKYPKANALVG
ncbi:MAG TPA: potassium transporter TrkG [Flavobacteriales bacterium]|nr:ATPase [Flavobacteriales bacterium]HRE74050.1 potassium transporter TrkG [Flavobacteriales bacterium]HRE95913.1 potassium transporter TrkG [Flavobacteriales bacterium]HRJ34424.1 potassium transporter TrkG [Flavobacteriales bacterium]HRJ38272.1 potassium transporter TrkG [Flavobacteriales bacterium]